MENEVEKSTDFPVHNYMYLQMKAFSVKQYFKSNTKHIDHQIVVLLGWFQSFNSAHGIIKHTKFSKTKIKSYSSVTVDN